MRKFNLQRIDFQKFAMATMLVMLATTMIGALAGVPVFASGNVQGTTTEVVETVMGVIELVAAGVGAFMLVLGIIKFATAHANENGPEQQKAIMQMVSGTAVLILALAVLPSLESTVAGWISGAGIAAGK